MENKMIKLGVNIDHIATLRQARKTYEPEPALAVSLVETGGGDGITVHLREDRRHINERDLQILREIVSGKLNLEMSLSTAIVKIALTIKPDQITLVPEKREEVTTEGGLDCTVFFESIKKTVSKFQEKEIETSLFVDPDESQIETAIKLNVDRIELHTGEFSNLYYLERGNEKGLWKNQIERLFSAAKSASKGGLLISAGHGLNYLNINEIKPMPFLDEVNIGHSIISRALFTGLKQAVNDMKKLIS